MLPIPQAATVKFVGPLLKYHVYDGAAVIAVFRREAVVLNFELLDNLNRRLVIHVRVAALSLFRSGYRAAIQSDVCRRIALAVRNKVRSSRVVVVNPGSTGFGHSTREKNQSEHTAVV